MEILVLIAEVMVTWMIVTLFHLLLAAGFCYLHVLVRNEHYERIVSGMEEKERREYINETVGDICLSYVFLSMYLGLANTLLGSYPTINLWEVLLMNAEMIGLMLTLLAAIAGSYGIGWCIAWAYIPLMRQDIEEMYLELEIEDVQEHINQTFKEVFLRSGLILSVILGWLILHKHFA